MPERIIDKPFPDARVEDIFSIQGRGTVVDLRPIIEKGICKVGEGEMGSDCRVHRHLARRL